MISNLVVRAAQVGMVIGGAVAVAPSSSPEEFGMSAWTIRAVLGLGLAAVAYLLNDTMKTIRDTKKTQQDHAVRIALHDIMYEQWLDELSDGRDLENNPGRRRSDQIIRAIVHETRKTTGEKG